MQFRAAPSDVWILVVYERPRQKPEIFDDADKDFILRGSVNFEMKFLVGGERVFPLQIDLGLDKAIVIFAQFVKQSFRYIDRG